MSLFFLVFGSVIVGGAAYLASRIMSYSGPVHSSLLRAPLFLVTLGFCILQFIVPVLSRWGATPSEYLWVSRLGYVTLGIAGVLFFHFLALDVLEFLRGKLAWGHSLNRDWFRMPTAIWVLMSGFSMSAWGIKRAWDRPQVETVSIPLLGWAGKTLQKPFRILQITDLHIGPLIREEMIDGVIAAASGHEVDIVVITGDLLDGLVSDIGPLVARLIQGLRAERGIYYITGNHEFYWGAAAWVRFLRELGVTVLENESQIFEHESEAKFVLIGVHDLQADDIDPVLRCDIDQAIASIASEHRELPRVLLAHNPNMYKRYEGRHSIDLQLSGHTHGGQFYPWAFLVQLVYRYSKGLYRHSNGTWIYVGRGTGFWGPPQRLGVPSEITIVALTPPPVA